MYSEGLLTMSGDRSVLGGFGGGESWTKAFLTQEMDSILMGTGGSSFPTPPGGTSRGSLNESAVLCGRCVGV